MKKTILLLISTLFIFSCSSTANVEIKSNTLTQEEADMNYLVDISNELLLKLKSHYLNELLPSKQFIMANGRTVSEQTVKKLYDEAWNKYFNNYFYILKVNFLYDHLYQEGVFKDQETRNEILTSIRNKRGQTNDVAKLKQQCIDEKGDLSLEKCVYTKILLNMEKLAFMNAILLNGDQNVAKIIKEQGDANYQYYLDYYNSLKQ